MTTCVRPSERGRAANLAASGPGWRVGARAVGQVVVLDAVGGFDALAEGLDRAIKYAVADRPRGLVCDLSGLSGGGQSYALDVLASAGRHVRDWSGLPIAVVCPDATVRSALTAHPLGRHLRVTASLGSALAAVLGTSAPTEEAVRLAPHPTAPRAARDLVARTLPGWGMSDDVPVVSLVVSELVTNAMVHAGTDVDVCLAAREGSVRLAVMDGGPDLPVQRGGTLNGHGRGLAIVANLSRAWGVLPTIDGGKVVWSVVDARSSTEDP